MSDWKKRMFDGYVSTGQARAPEDLEGLANPYYDRLIAAHLPTNKEILIVDLASGHGRLIYSLKKSGYKNVVGVDISKEQVATAHRLGLTEVQHQDISEFLQEAKAESFDVIFLMDILEHLEEQETLDLLDKVHRTIRKSGVLVLHVPNGEGLFGMRVRYGDFTHRRAYTSMSIGQVLSACGFEMTKCLEDKPAIHGVKSFVRFILWETLTMPFRILLTAESGVTGHILSQNLLAIARKSPDSRSSRSLTATADL